MRISKVILTVLVLVSMVLPVSAQTIIDAENFKSKLKESYELFCLDAQLPDMQVTITDIKKDEKGLYGSIDCTPQNKDWLCKGAVKWWSNGKVIVFHIDKIIEPPASQGEAVGLINEAYKYVGGISDQDPRPFKRFGKDVNELYLKDEFRRIFVEAGKN